MNAKEKKKQKTRQAVGFAIAVVGTHQDFAAVAEPAAAVLAGQDEGEGLAVNNNYKHVIISKN